ncbi:hypothetical protein CMEL01_13065 [Colletotrichum melonis]|uniref:Uncharacterized protein n=1 Tax=Colletotrichum melonis TaxID=1209925 RepID=A0AAI9UT93_9PEZI|nr:hypothetical protein CMEL01_13065 [Colletotrichum melonis]
MAAWQRGFASVAPGLAQAWVMAPAVNVEVARILSLKYFSAISLPLQDKYVFQHLLDGKFLQDWVPATINSRAKHHPPQFGGGSYLLHTTPTRRAAMNGFGKMIGSRKIIRSCCGALGIVSLHGGHVVWCQESSLTLFNDPRLKMSLVLRSVSRPTVEFLKPNSRLTPVGNSAGCLSSIVTKVDKVMVHHRIE